uniref:Probable 6-phosphogluconolactonase n=1 Tax=Ananas comosus var. bracteatus TaxID=296719 RepID=A0A6V7Q4J1_ANACO|nr:unnamed protein product [Ananas comosus var. bracteatus]
MVLGSGDFSKERGSFTIALSGGPLVGLIGKLCEAPYSMTVDWTRWYIFWTDERAVAKNHADSNYKTTKDRFLSKVPILNSHVYSINDNVTVEDAAGEYEFAIRQLVKLRKLGVSESNDCPKFDLIILSMGPDGHVASLFPDHPALRVKDEWVTFITDSPEPPPERITFTLPVINSASNVAVVVTGEDKATAARAAVSGNVRERIALLYFLLEWFGQSMERWLGSWISLLPRILEMLSTSLSNCLAFFFCYNPRRFMLTTWFCRKYSGYLVCYNFRNRLL